MMKLSHVFFGVALFLCGMVCSETEGEGSSRRIYREARLVRGNTNIVQVQPIDEASWIWCPDAERGIVFLKFRTEFEVKNGEAPLVIDVSADERYYLTCDGEFVSRGPNRSMVENWQYNTYELKLSPGRHIMEAVVWKTGDAAPLAQLSCRGGFILKADGVYDERLTTGKAKWKVGALDGIEAMGSDNGVWGTGAQWKITGSGILNGEPEKWNAAVVVRGPIAIKGPQTWGLRTQGWMLFPSQLPDQLEEPVHIGKIVAVTTEAAWRTNHLYTAAETNTPEVARLNDFIARRLPVYTVPAHTHLQIAWDLGRYICAYPKLELGPAKDARVSWTWTESSLLPDGRKGREPNARNEIVGRSLAGYGDVFIPDAERIGVFTTPWFRCGKWCRLDIETGDEALELSDIALIESRYPLSTDECAFSSPDDPSLQSIRAIGARAMQMCCHEMLFDCPYYEQQMYPGDTRVQLNTISALSSDDRMIKRAIELFDLAVRDDGQCPFNWPTRGTQEGATYTLCYLLMYGDYVMNHADRAWLKARLPGFRMTMAGIEYYENQAGLLENLPGWQFVDWVPSWQGGVAPGGLWGSGVNAEANLFWVLAMESAAKTERALGNEGQAAYWEVKSAKLKKAILSTFWCEARGLLADTPEMKSFSEHAQALAIIGDVLPPEKRAIAFRHLVEDPDLARCTVYFSFYLFDAYFRMGRGDLFLKRLDLWRESVKSGLTTTQEEFDTADHEARSDCHAWGAHPIWWMQTGLAGIRSAAPFFEKVLVAPCPGMLAALQATHPHPHGSIIVNLHFVNGHAAGTVRTPVEGSFVFGDQKVNLVPGLNEIR